MSDKPNEPQPDTGHEYDGIRENDNVLPNWWLATLFITIIFGFGYWTYYHMLGAGPLPQAEYAAEVDAATKAAREAARSRGAVSDELLLKMSQAPATVQAGAAIFKTNCIACHGEKGEGKIGPNLTDGVWLHGGKPTEILKTVSDGVLSKGMVAWEPTLGTDRVQDVVAFVLTLKNTNVPGKAPEGVPEQSAAPAKAPEAKPQDPAPAANP